MGLGTPESLTVVSGLGTPGTPASLTVVAGLGTPEILTVVFGGGHSQAVSAGEVSGREDQ